MALSFTDIIIQRSMVRTLNQKPFSKNGSLSQISPGIVEDHVDVAFEEDVPLVIMVKEDAYSCMTLSLDLSKRSHRELGFWAVVKHAFRKGSDAVALVLPCWFDVKSQSLSLSYEANDKNAQGYPVLSAISVDSQMEIVEGVFFEVFQGSFDVSVFPRSEIPLESLAAMKSQLGIKNLDQSDPRLEKSSISIEDPVWSSMLESRPVVH